MKEVGGLGVWEKIPSGVGEISQSAPARLRVIRQSKAEAGGGGLGLIEHKRHYRTLGNAQQKAERQAHGCRPITRWPNLSACPYTTTTSLDCKADDPEISKYFRVVAVRREPIPVLDHSSLSPRSLPVKQNHQLFDVYVCAALQKWGYQVQRSEVVRLKDCTPAVVFGARAYSGNSRGGAGLIEGCCAWLGPADQGCFEHLYRMLLEDCTLRGRAWRHCAGRVALLRWEIPNLTDSGRSSWQP